MLNCTSRTLSDWPVDRMSLDLIEVNKGELAQGQMLGSRACREKNQAGIRQCTFWAEDLGGPGRPAMRQPGVVKQEGRDRGANLLSCPHRLQICSGSALSLVPY